MSHLRDKNRRGKENTHRNTPGPSNLPHHVLQVALELIQADARCLLLVVVPKLDRDEDGLVLADLFPDPPDRPVPQALRPERRCGRAALGRVPAGRAPLQERQEPIAPSAVDRRRAVARQDKIGRSRSERRRRGEEDGRFHSRSVGLWPAV